MTRLLTLFFFILSIPAMSQTHDLIGYWHNWDDVNAPYIQLDQIDNRYTIIEVSFATPTSSTNMTMQFVPVIVSNATLITKIQTLQSQNKKVLLSIGGANGTLDLTTTANKNAFISSMTTLLDDFGFDGFDLDIENGPCITASGTIANPTNQAQINLIDAVKQIMQTYHTTHNKKMILTMAPETAYVQGGMSAYGGIWGGYLPIIDALRDSLDVLQVQLYNSGSMMGVDNNIYTSGTADFITSQTEAVIYGFNTSGGAFNGLPAHKVAVGLPACTSAAGSGYMVPSVVKSAIDYLRGMGPNPGSYTLATSASYNDLRGMMTWSINWDAVASCNGAYSYAANYQVIFGNPTEVSQSVSSSLNYILAPNPVTNRLFVYNKENTKEGMKVMITDLSGKILLQEQGIGSTLELNVENLSAGCYFLKVNKEVIRFQK